MFAVLRRHRAALVLGLAIALLAAFSLPAVAAEAKYLGSKKSDVYHYPHCRYVQNIKPENVRTFASAAEALQAGYRPGKVCKPPTKD